MFVNNSSKTLPERSGAPLERCALENRCGKVPELYTLDLYGASYGNLTEAIFEQFTLNTMK